MTMAAVETSCTYTAPDNQVKFLLKVNQVLTRRSRSRHESPGPQHTRLAAHHTYHRRHPHRLAVGAASRLHIALASANPHAHEHTRTHAVPAQSDRPFCRVVFLCLGGYLACYLWCRPSLAVRFHVGSPRCPQRSMSLCNVVQHSQ